jgi:hypothetical protein
LGTKDVLQVSKRTDICIEVNLFRSKDREVIGEGFRDLLCDINRGAFLTPVRIWIVKELIKTASLVPLAFFNAFLAPRPVGCVDIGDRARIDILYLVVKLMGWPEV